MKNNTNPYYHPEEERGAARRHASSSPYSDNYSQQRKSTQRSAYDQAGDSDYEYADAQQSAYDQTGSGKTGKSRKSGKSGKPAKASSARGKKKNSNKKKKSLGQKLLIAAAVVLLVVVGGYWGLNRLVTGGGGSLSGAIGTPDEIQADVVNILCAGIDYEEGRDYSNGMGMTDVVLYVSYDIKANKINMLQIPRDTYVGTEVPTGQTGKINAVARFGGTDPAIESLANVINDQLKLPVDYYITIDMDAFKAVINALNGIEVTVPFDITDDFGNTLHAGTQVIDGATAEFMVRQRHNYSNADLGRLEMQRYMYSALLKKFKSLPLADVIKVIPAYIQYVKTDISVGRMGALATKVRSVPSENIIMMKLPCEGATYNGLSVVSAHLDETAEMLNTYFRPYSDPVPASELKIIELKNTGASSGTVQSMDSIDNGTAEWGKDSVQQPATSEAASGASSQAK